VNEKQKVLFIAQLKTAIVASNDFARAINTYALHSPYAFREPDELEKQRGDLVGLWERAAETLAERFLENPGMFRALVKKYGSCFVLAVFWNHVTAVLDELLNRASRNEYPIGPIFELMTDYSLSCAVCLKRYELEFQHVSCWATDRPSPLALTKELMRRIRERRYYSTV
jgi:hypothetical protein